MERRIKTGLLIFLFTLASVSAATINGNISTTQLTGNSYLATRQTNTGYLPYVAELVGNYSYDNVANTSILWVRIYDGYHNLRNTTTFSINLMSDNFDTRDQKLSQILWNQYLNDAGGYQNAFLYMGKEMLYDAQIGVCWSR